MTEKKENSVLLLEVITPEKVFYKGAVHLVNIPGLQGELGILCGHMALLVELKSGLVSTFDATMSVNESFVISGGFAEMNHKSLAILTEEAGFLRDFDSKQVSDSIAKYQEDFKTLHPSGYTVSKFITVVVRSKSQLNEENQEV